MAHYPSIQVVGIVLVLLHLTANVHAQNNASEPAPPLNGTFADNLPGSQIVCTPTNWYDIIWFYVANYVLHALSVRSLPGENLFASLVFKLACLMIPYTGIRRGLCLIARSSNFTRNDLQAAARANALCMVVRGADWRPVNGQTVSGCTVEKIPRASSTEIHDAVQNDAAEKEILGRANTHTEDGSGKSLNKEYGPIVRIKRIFTTRTNTSVSTGPLTLQSKHMGKKPFKERFKDKFTDPIVRNTEDKSGCIAFKTTDCYTPAPARNALEKTYRLLVETYKFGRSSLGNSVRLDPEYVKVHGLCNMPPGFELVYVPIDIQVHPRGSPRERPTIWTALRNRNFHQISKSLTSSTRLASTQNAPRILFSLVQTVSGAWSLYRAQGLQIERFGYAAYGLTVLPYMIVSVINFVGSLLTKEYDMVYLVHSSIMDEMISQGGSVDGVIGSVEPPTEVLAEPDTPLSTSPIPLPREPPSLLQSEGDTLRFNIEDCETTITTLNAHQINDNDTPSTAEAPPQQILAYQQASPNSVRSDDYKITTIPTWKPGSLDSMTWGKEGWRRLRKEHRRKHGGDTGDEPPPGITIINVPSHGTMIRLPPPIYEPFLQVIAVCLLLAAFVTPFIVITILTRWQANQSESSHRSFVLNWLVCGIFLGYFAGTVEKLSGNSAVMKGLLVVFLSYGTYCISGFVAVAQEMIMIGKCTAI